MKYIVLMFVCLPLIFLTASCEKMDTERKVLFDEVMDIHDICMPEMTSLNKIQRKLRKYKEKMKKEESNDQATMDGIADMILQIQKAEDGMMNWMRELEVPKNKQPDSEVMPYLKSEKVKISKVSDDMFQALEDGRALLKTLNIK